MLAVAKLLTLLKLSKGIAVLLVNTQLQLGLKVHTITYLFLVNQYHMYPLYHKLGKEMNT